MFFKCACCDKSIEGVPTFGFGKPLHYFDVPEAKRQEDVLLTEDLCVIADRWFFVRGCIEIPVHGAADPFIWGVWASLSEPNFLEFQSLLGVKERSHFGPYFGWLSAALRPYPDTENLKTMVHLRDDGVRPLIVVEPNGHPLAVEQQSGISTERLGEIYALVIEGQHR